MEESEDAEIGSEKLYRLADEIKNAVDNGAMIVQSSEEAKEINENGLKSMEDISATMEKQSATMETIYNNASNLSDTIYKLEELINRFKI